MTAMVHLDNALWPKMGSDADDEVKVRFADSAANDITTMAGSVQMLAAANSASIETRVRMLHPDWTQKQIIDEVERLKNPERLGMMTAGVISPEEMRAYYLDETTQQATAELQAMRQKKAKEALELMADEEEETEPAATEPEEKTE